MHVWKEVFDLFTRLFFACCFSKQESEHFWFQRSAVGGQARRFLLREQREDDQQRHHCSAGKRRWQWGEGLSGGARLKYLTALHWCWAAIEVVFFGKPCLLRTVLSLKDCSFASVLSQGLVWGIGSGGFPKEPPNFDPQVYVFSRRGKSMNFHLSGSDFVLKP